MNAVKGCTESLLICTKPLGYGIAGFWAWKEWRARWCGGRRLRDLVGVWNWCRHSGMRTAVSEGARLVKGGWWKELEWRIVML